LKTNFNRSVHKEEITASICEVCNSNCLCSGKIEPGKDSPALCDLGCVDTRHLLVKGKDGGENNCDTVCPALCAACHLDDK